jgi:hypothetical protein
VTPTPIALVAVRAELPDFPAQTGRLFDRVYGFLRSHESLQSGHNVVVYDLPLALGSAIRIGVQVAASFEPESGILCTATPARATRTLRVGVPTTGSPRHTTRSSTGAATRPWR